MEVFVEERKSTCPIFAKMALELGGLVICFRDLGVVSELPPLRTYLLLSCFSQILLQIEKGFQVSHLVSPEFPR